MDSNKKIKVNLNFTLLFIIIAIVIGLGVIISIFGSVPSICCDAQSSTKQLLVNQINDYNKASCTEQESLSKSNNNRLNVIGITKDTGLDPEQVYFDNPEEISYLDVNITQLRSTISASKKVIICIICSDNRTNLASAINSNKREGDNFGIIPTTAPSNETLCVVYPREIR